jgi:hypothetical protein
VVRNTKRYTLARHVATATTLITIRGMPRHGKLKNSNDASTSPACHPETMPLHRHPDQHSRSLLAQFGLTPKSGRGLAARDVLDQL